MYAAGCILVSQEHVLGRYLRNMVVWCVLGARFVTSSINVCSCTVKEVSFSTHWMHVYVQDFIHIDISMLSCSVWAFIFYAKSTISNLLTAHTTFTWILPSQRSLVEFEAQLECETSSLIFVCKCRYYSSTSS